MKQKTGVVDVPYAAIRSSFASHQFNSERVFFIKVIDIQVMASACVPSLLSNKIENALVLHNGFGKQMYGPPR